MKLTRRRFSENQKLAYIRSFRQSGSTVHAYCKQQGLVASAFRRWLNELSETSQETIPNSEMANSKSYLSSNQKTMSSGGQQPLLSEADLAALSGKREVAHAAEAPPRVSPTKIHESPSTGFELATHSAALSYVRHKILKVKVDALRSSLLDSFRELAIATAEGDLDESEVTLFAMQMYENALSRLLEQTTTQVLTLRQSSGNN